MSKYSLLIAEDDEDLINVFELMLGEHFAVTTTTNGAEAIAEIQKKNFHIVIVDIHMPTKSGLEVCEFIQTLKPDRRPSVIVLSGDLSDENIHKAFSLGATDFVGKPFNVVAFHERIMRISRDIVQIKALRSDDDRRRSLADTAMKQASAYGSGLELLARLNKCKSIESLMEKITFGLLAQGYHCAVEFRSDSGRYNFDVDTRQCSENEQKIFQLLYDKGRIFHFGKRTIFNESNASLLVKNMPTEGTMSYDAAIDLFAKLVPALGSRFDALLNIQTMLSSREQLNETIKTVKHTIEIMERERKDNLEQIAATIGISFHELEMTETQERFFLDLIEKQLTADNTNERFGKVVELLEETAESLNSDELVDDEEEQIEDNFDDDIELF
ncbi:response regulator [Alteromonas sp. ASW11-36]|uniref:Response regulator n=1 Tax=Alteromonas arenosi TaxID=3055817 RepID=A0ABT7T0D8_9ALTE|nr:response regulator [Alteromonas sp. ASW11-36]MDM7861890.1 response regulator [Alteromonas sp. ASW11-36]